MLLAIDIGNTNLVIGCIENDELVFKARIATSEPEPLTSMVLRSKI